MMLTGRVDSCAGNEYLAIADFCAGVHDLRSAYRLEGHMARIVIADLDQNVELDRDAMRAVVGGRSPLRRAQYRLHGPASALSRATSVTRERLVQEAGALLQPSSGKSRS
jgi:hypothetical protein